MLDEFCISWVKVNLAGVCRGVQWRDKYRRGLVVEALARVTQSGKVWTGESQQERGGSKAYERLPKITIILGYSKFCATERA